MAKHKLENKGKLPWASIKEFQRIYLNEYGEKISAGDALIQSNKLITFFKAIANYIELKELRDENKD